MLVIINGPLGIGKSTTAWGLVARFEKAVMLDMDYIAEIHPFDFYNPAHLDYCLQTLAVLIRHHQAHGYQQFVVNWVFETEALLARLKSEVADTGLAVQVFRLSCDPDVVEQRIRARNLPNVEWEVQRGRDLLTILERAATEGDLGTVINTSHLTPDEVVEHIWHHLEF